jgi:hypothetical protein
MSRNVGIISFVTLKSKNSELRAAIEQRELLERELIGKKGKARLRAAEADILKARKNEEELMKDVLYLRDALKATGGAGGYAETPDEQPLPAAECVGYAYGYAVYVDDERHIRVEKTDDWNVAVGDLYPDDARDCALLSELPRGEQEMILRYLEEQPTTPDWFKGRMAI